jgi:protocatechuate 3,4-dioxygenase beta subunit
VVYLNRESRGTFTPRQARQLTDTRGRFAFVEVPPYDRYQLAASQFGYFDGGFGASNEPGTTNRTLALADGQWITDQRIQVHRPAAISGVVTDETGEPVAGAYVRAMARISVAGRLHLASGPSATTDDRGAYRPRLPPVRAAIWP